MKFRMGDSCHSFIADEYPDNCKLRIVALQLRAATIKSDVDYDFIELEAKEILTAIDEWYGDPSSPRRLVLKAKCKAYYLLGNIAFRRRNPELAIKYYEDCKGIMLSAGHSNDDFPILGIKIQIARAEEMLPDGCQKSSNERILQLQNQIYAQHKKEGDSSRIILEGVRLSRSLMTLSEFGEAKTLLEELKPHSIQVHGQSHPKTRKIEDLFEECECELL